jgi:glycosyltransferase involved in cell wall biosynthesis
VRLVQRRPSRPRARTGPRLAYLTGEYPRATDTFIQREVTALRRSGFEIDTFAVRRPGTDHLTGSEQRHGQESTTYLLELARGPALPVAHLLAIATAPGRYLRGLRLAWETRRPGLRGTIYQLIYFAEAVLLGHELHRRGIDHLHNHFGDSSCTVAMLASEVSGLPYSFTLHGSAIFFDAHAWHLGDKLDRAAFCACISHFTRSQAAIFASPETMDRVYLVHCGIEPERLRPVTHRGVGSRLVFVGRVVEQKGLKVLFESMQQLVPDHPELTLTIIGDGPDRMALEQRADKMGLASRVDFVGSKSQTEVADLLGEADVFVLPSYAEGVPVVVMEALACGIPVVASFVGGMAELVEDGVTGFLVRPGDAEQLADRIGRLVADPELRNRFGSAGRSMVTAEFDSTIEARRLGSLFIGSAIGRSSPVRPRADPDTGELTG